jgi:hypothetical protein
MNYSLGNMLGGAGALNADKLSLDLQFAADKTLTARKGPTPTFTRASTATFVGSNGLIQSAAINAARFDHDPVTLACKGLLIEESRTNFILNSDLYSTSTPTNITATTITGTSVTGSSQIRELSLTASGALTGVQANLTGTGTGTKTLSVFIKKPTSNAAPYFTIGFASSALVYAGIQLTMSGSAPVISVTSTSNTFAVVSSSLETFSNDWYRVSVVVSGTAANCFPTMYPSNAIWDGTSDIRQTLIASGTNLIYIFGAQLEAGSFPTSYIPTVASSVVRSADVCSITGASFTSFYNQSEGTVIVNGDSAGASGSRWCGTGPIRAFELYGKTSLVYFESSGVSENTIGAISLPTKFGLACKLNDFQGVRNGTLGGADTNATMPSPTTFHIGNLLGASSWLNGCIVSIRYYRKRLTNAKLQSLTAP